MSSKCGFTAFILAAICDFRSNGQFARTCEDGFYPSDIEADGDLILAWPEVKFLEIELAGGDESANCASSDGERDRRPVAHLHEGFPMFEDERVELAIGGVEPDEDVWLALRREDARSSRCQKTAVEQQRVEKILAALVLFV
jgi:hypothetical protein